MATVIGEFVAKIGADMKGFEKGVDKANTKMGQFAKDFSKHRKAIGAGMTAMGGAIVGGLGLAMKSAADFEAGMREVNTMMGLGQEEFQAMSADVLKLAKDIGVNAVEATGALYQAISAGVPQENVLTFMEIATKAAIGGVTDTETAVDGLTTVLNAFKIPMEDAQKVADIMFTTVKGGKTTFEELASKLFNVAPIAAATGISFMEVSAALATMTKQGFPTAQATTGIRQAIVQLQKPTVDMAATIDKLGFSSGEAMIEELGLAGTLNALRDATGGSNQVLAKMFASTEAIGAIFALTGDNAQTFADDLDAMASASDGAGASTEAFNEIERGSARQLEKAQASIKAVAIEIGGNLLPALTPIIAKVGEIVTKVSDWMEANPELTGTIVKIVAVVGALMLVVGPLLLALPMIIAGFTALMGPIGLVVLAITALIAVGALVIANWDKIKIAFINTINAIIGGINRFIQTLNRVPGVEIGMLGRFAGGFQTMHSGGVVPGRPGQDVPIMAQAGEVVTPAGARGGPTIIVNVGGSVISERDIAEIVREQFYLTQNRDSSLDFR